MRSDEPHLDIPKGQPVSSYIRAHLMQVPTDSIRCRCSISLDGTSLHVSRARTHVRGSVCSVAGERKDGTDGEHRGTHEHIASREREIASGNECETKGVKVNLVALITHSAATVTVMSCERCNSVRHVVDAMSETCTYALDFCTHKRRAVSSTYCKYISLVLAVCTLTYL